MKAAQFSTYGPASVIEINATTPEPEPSSGQILVKVSAAGINPVESAIRNGYMKDMLPLTLPAIVGGDFSGVITEVGEGVTEFAVGDEVYGLGNPFKGGSGAVAEFVSVQATTTGLKPESIDHFGAAALPLAGTSALQAIEEHIAIKEGQKILIHGGAGGVGSLAILLAKLNGAYVTATASTEALEFVTSLGADEVIDYKTQDFTTLVSDYDAVFDTVGGEITNKSIPVLKKGGILVSMAGQPDQELAKKHEVTALTQMTKGDTDQLTRLATLVDEGKIKPLIDTVFPLGETKEAYTLLDEGHPKGKIVIDITK